MFFFFVEKIKGRKNEFDFF
jgi:hypothetical protein